LAFSVCSKTGAILYKAQSQDEDALVHAAAKLNMVLVCKNGNILGKTHFHLAVEMAPKLDMIR
jgi:phospholipid-translocating ATPase